MHFKTLSPKQALNKAYQRQKPFRNEFNNFKEKLLKFLESLDPMESEEYNKKFAAEFFEKTFYSDNLVNTSGKIDLAIYLGKDAKSKVGVIGEVKSPLEKNDMLTKDNLNVKAMHQVILYYLRERIEEKNDDIKNIFISNGYEWFIFDAKLFERIFYKNSELLKRYKSWAADKKVSSNTDHFYKEIASDFLNNLDTEIEFVHFDLRNYRKELDSKKGNETKLISLYKLFSKPFLLKEQFTNDSNSLDKSFYNELLYIIGLEEVKEGSKKLIRRKNEEKREPGSIIENTIEKLKSKDTLAYFEDTEKFGEDDEERLFNIALQLNITWINRILFLKLLEAQLVNYHQGNADYKFLDKRVITEYDDLDELFHEVLARKLEERSTSVKEKFKKIPYLNSSLFERSELERNTISIDSLKDRFKINVHHSTVLKDEKDNRFKGELSTLKYLLKFLDAYDFSTESTGEEIQEEGKSLINASVLGLIFEKINGYKEGSFFTPGFITMYMSRETLRRAVVQKFNDELKSSYKDFDELKSEIDRTKEGREKANEIISSLKICDPAVGSGHFLVSVLNEIITIKSELGLLCYRDGSRVQNYSVEIENDELIITDVETEDIFKYHLNQKGNVIDELQRMQETIFYEKQTIIENCLFGVDINPNSVNICRLRLWIELLKNSYYTKKSGYKELETLPNIDINIKQGNSLISRFDLGDQVFTKGDKTSLELYKMNVKLYKNATDRDERKKLKDSIEKIKDLLLGMYEDPLNEDRKRLRKLNGELTDHQITLGELDGKSEAIKKRLEERIDKLANKIVKQEEENELICRDAFEWRFEFPEVLDEEGNFEGFDVVIGNPPWGDYFTKVEKQKLKENYVEIDSSTPNAFAYFIGLSNRIFNYNYFLLLPDSFLLKDYEKTRMLIKKNLIILGWFQNTSMTYKLQPFKDVEHDVSFIMVTKAVTDKIICYERYFNTNVKSVFERLTTRTKEKMIFEEYGNIYNLIMTDSDYNIKRKLDVLGKLNDELQIHEGIHTGNIRDKLFFNYKISEEAKPLFLGAKHGDVVENYFGEPSGWYVKYDSQLINKKKGEYASLRDENIFSLPKIYITRTGDPFKAFIDKNTYASNNFFSLQFIDYNENTLDNLKVVLCIINSSFARYYIRKIVAPRIGKTFVETKIIHLLQIPFPEVTPTLKNQLENLVDQILTTKKENPEADTSALEREIDELVYKLYGLTEEEIRIVEGSVG